MIAHHASAQCEDTRGNAYALAFFGTEYRLDYLIHTYTKPVLCWGHGIVMGGGVGLMSGASHRIVTEQSRVAMPEITIGLFPDVGGTWMLNRAPGRTGVFLGLTGAQLNADDALFARLADYKLMQSDKAAVMSALKSTHWGGDSNVVGRILHQVLRRFNVPSTTPGPLRKNFDWINDACAAYDWQEIVRSLCGYQGDDAWLQRAAATLAAGSPSSAGLAVALQRRLLHASLAEVFRVELVAALTCATRPDLAEGIRALLIDKDRKPRWQPASIDQVTPEWLNGFFRDLWSSETHPLREIGTILIAK
jgi:enoyl-CoA hydratase/carnithine racemase